VQLHGPRFQAFIRYEENNEAAISAAIEKVGLGFDHMPSEFENVGVLFHLKDSAADLNIPTAIKKLHAAGVISEKFKDTMYTQEIHIHNIRRHPEPEVPESPFMNLFDRLEKLIASYSCSSKRTGLFFHSSLPKPLSQIQVQLEQIKLQQVSVHDGLKEIAQIAKKMGESHPLLLAANKCLGAVGSVELSKEDRMRVASKSF
jgi:hypothetical protein